MPPRLVEVPGAIEQSQFNTGNFGETNVAFHASEQIGLVDLCESCGGLVNKLEPVTADLEVTKLLRNDHLEGHGRLVRGTMIGCCAEQRDTI